MTEKDGLTAKFEDYRYAMKHILTMLCLIFCFWKVTCAQPEKTTMGEFLDALAAIEPVDVQLRYDTFPGFDFGAFRPLVRGTGTIKYCVGFSPDRTIRGIIWLDANDSIVGRMDVYHFPRFKLLIFQKQEVVLNEYPDFPIFCIDDDSRFIVYLNKRFQYGESYGPSDVAVIHVLREDLFPVRILQVKNQYVRMLSSVNYVNGQSRIVDDVFVNIVFEPQEDANLLLTDESTFSEDDFYIPASDFTATLVPLLEDETMPVWFFHPFLRFR